MKPMKLYLKVVELTELCAQLVKLFLKLVELYLKLLKIYLLLIRASLADGKAIAVFGGAVLRPFSCFLL